MGAQRRANNHQPVARKERSVFREHNRPLNPGIRFTPSGLKNLRMREAHPAHCVN